MDLDKVADQIQFVAERLSYVIPIEVNQSMREQYHSLM